MNLLSWFRSVRNPSPCPPPHKGKLICIDCGRGIHRHERYTILSARHRDCSDPKLVGQKSLPEIQEATLGD